MHAIQQNSIHGGTIAGLAMMPLLALVGFTNGSSVGGTMRPVASGHVAITGRRVDQVIEHHLRVLQPGRLADALRPVGPR